MFCKKCGHELAEETRFCPHCGADQNGQGVGGGYAPPAAMKCVSFGTAVKNLFKNYGNFRGRATRGEYWWVVLFNLIVSFVLVLIPMVLIPIIGIVLGLVYSLALFIAGLSLFVRRLHDVGKSWPYMLFLLIPLVGLIIVVVWLCTASDGDNRWGPDPRRQAEASTPASRPQAVPVAASASHPQAAPVPPDVQGNPTPQAEPAVNPPVQEMIGTITAPQVIITYMCDGAQKRVGIRDFPCIIGRDSSAAKLVLHDSKVSRVHAQIYRMEQTFYLEDMQSANGTVLNGTKIQGVTELHSGDVIVMGITRLSIEIE